MEIVSASSRAKLPSPNACSAAICRNIACADDFTAGSAILLAGVKSRIVLTLALRVLRKIGIADSAATPLTAPRVFSHSSANGGMPPDTKSTLPDSNASFIPAPPEIVTQFTLRSPKPAALACFSSSRFCSMTTSGK